MSARNMVRNLRDSGALGVQPEAPAWRSRLLAFAGAALFGALLYFGIAVGLPRLVESMEKKPPPVHYAKPQDRTPGG